MEDEFLLVIKNLEDVFVFVIFEFIIKFKIIRYGNLSHIRIFSINKIILPDDQNHETLSCNSYLLFFPTSSLIFALFITILIIEHSDYITIFILHCTKLLNLFSRALYMYI